MALKDRLGKLNETVDRLKTQAGTLADKAQEQARLGQQRLEQFQAKKQADQLLLELGGLAYLDQAGRLDEQGHQRMASLLDQLRAFEAANGPITVTRAVPPPGDTGNYVPAGAGGTPPAPSPAPSPGTPSTEPGPAPGFAPSGGPLPKATYASDQDAENPAENPEP
ncbi:hypothetical protein ACFFRE_07020 [Aciditerrimonas ferrireducens]|uniref:Uncharacterized protein n=1 Tax=Aciditerrimonas ferrireducens TaxID=667306 RepID=A0ABV6C6J6_9ACTN|nr:hypothetical protein [Aciditerrimonas ferrireducens]MCK4178021.1 hypothetical protein [Aciditerrimonas ferrireducens]